MPEVDYQALMAQMPGQSHPRRKLKELQNKGILIRLKKGFYVFSNEWTGTEFSPQVAANLLYGPSYLSLEYALAYYHLIPERVEVFTSVTTMKNKTFNTPIACFTYSHLASSIYPLGVTIKKFDNRSFLIATPLKALMDIFTLKFDNSEKPVLKDIYTALEDDLRVDTSELKKHLNRVMLLDLKPFYKNRRWNKLLIDFLVEIL